MSKLSITNRNPGISTLSTEKIQGPELDSQHWLWEQQESKAWATQWLPEVPGPQCQGAGNAADVEQVLLC